MTLEVCDRCGVQIKGWKYSFTIKLDNDVTSFVSYKAYRYKEVCPNCAKEIKNMLDNVMDVIMNPDAIDKEEK